MRTDTATFASRVFKQVRALGISCARSREVTRSIVSGISGGSYNPYGNGGFDRRAVIASLDLILNASHEHFHCLEVIVDGQFAFTASTRNHILVNVEPTPAQIVLYDRIHASRLAVREAIAEACARWEEANGYPADDAAAEVRYQDVGADPLVVAARAAYRNLRNESLALNPHAHAWHIDPILFAEYSDQVKYERGSRPTGYITVAMMERYFASVGGAEAEFAQAA